MDMNPLLPLFAFIVTIFILLIIKANIEQRRRPEKPMTEEEKDQEWLDNQW